MVFITYDYFTNSEYYFNYILLIIIKIRELTYWDHSDKYPEKGQNIESLLHIGHLSTLCIYDIVLHLVE